MARGTQWNPAIACEKCGEKSLKRSEKGFLLSLKVLGVSAILAIPLLQSDTLIPWLPHWVQAGFILAFILSVCVSGYYAYYDRKHSFRCVKCFYEMSVPAPPFSFFQKVFIGLFGFGILFAIVGFIVIALTYKPQS